MNYKVCFFTTYHVKHSMSRKKTTTFKLLYSAECGVLSHGIVVIIRRRTHLELGG